MERILVFSDTHNDTAPCIRILDNMIGVTMVLHAGDHAKDAEELEMIFPEIPVRYVRGNCDFSSAPADLLIEVAGKRIFLTHGHLYGVKGEKDYHTLAQKAESLQADIAVFGHTHISYLQEGALTLLNPGSMKSMRSYAVIEIEDGKVGVAIIQDASF